MKNKFKVAELILIMAVAVLLSFSGGEIQVSAPARKTVVVDAGHGLPDGGAVGRSGVLESEINLKVSKALQKELEKNGVAVIMTRDGENGIYPEECETIKTKKIADMKKRAEIINGSGATLAVSIHMNYFGAEKYSGPQIFYPKGKESSKEAATFIKTAIKENIGEHCSREIKEVESGIYLFEKADIPIVLAECGFLSNNAEEKLLKSNSYCEKMGKAIAKGIILYLSESKS